MFKDNITEMDLDLQRPLNTYSQLEIARMILDKKKFVNDGNDISTVLNDTVLDTVGCVNEADFIEKYQEFFQQNEIPNFKINKIIEENGNTYFNVEVDNIPGLISTKDCTSIGDVKDKNMEILSNITSEQSYEILTNLTELMNLSVELEKASTVAVEQEEVIETTPVTNEPQNDNGLEQLLANKEKLEKRLRGLKNYQFGIIDDFKSTKLSPRFASRKAEIEEKIVALRNQENSKNSEQEITLEEFANIQATEFSSKVGYSEGTDEMNAITTFYKWVENPQDKDNFENLVNCANELSQESRLKEFLTETIKKVEENNFVQTTENTNQEVQESGLEEALEAVEKLNSFFVDDKNKNNAAMPFYYKAVETRDRLDILNAIIAVNQLDDSHMYKAKLKNALDELEKDYFSNMPQVEKSTTANNKTLEEVKVNVERLNSYFIDDKNRNNEAMPFYNKAMETKEKSDIFSAMVAVENLDDNHMYKKSLKEALEVLYRDSYPNENANVDRLIEAQSSVARYNRDLKDEKIKNNVAMPYYNKALETGNYDDILKAIEMTQQLDDNHMYKKPLLTALIAMIDTYYPKNQKDNSKEIANLQQEYDKLVKEEQDRIEKTEPLITKTQQELDELNKEIAKQQEQIQNQSNQPTPNQTSDSDIDLTPDEEDIDLTPENNQPHIIQSIKDAPAKLLNKIKNSEFGKKVADVMDYMLKHKLATAVITGGIILAGMGINASISNANTPEQNDIPPIEPIVEDTQEIVKDDEASQEVAINDNVEEKTEDEQFEESLQETLNNILSGDTKVYVSADRAANDIEAKNPLLSSLEQATPGAYYTMEDGVAQKMNEDEAQNLLQNGGQVIVRMDNDGTPIGFVPVEQQENNTGKSM